MQRGGVKDIGSRIAPKPQITLRSVAATVAVLPLLSARFRRNPYGIYRAVRSIEPVHRSPFGIWLVTGYDEAAAALKHPAIGNDEKRADHGLVGVGRLNRLLARKKPFESEGPFMDVFAEFMAFEDPPAHTRLRDAIMPAFTHDRMHNFHERLQQLTDDLLDSLGTHRSMDLVQDFAYPLAARTLCAFLGTDIRHEPRITAHSAAIATGLNPSPLRTPAMLADANRAVVALSELVQELVDDKRQEPDGTSLSEIVRQADSGLLTERELLVTVLGTMFAGHETTASLLSLGLRTLLQHPTQLERLRDDTALMRSAVEEMMRFCGPFQMLERVALDDVQLGGRVIPRGSILAVSPAAANRDPRRFESPERFDVTRRNNAQLGFGAGIHLCPGAALGRLTVNIAIGSVLARMPRLRLSGAPHWRPSFTIRGVLRQRVEW